MPLDALKRLWTDRNTARKADVAQAQTRVAAATAEQSRLTGVLAGARKELNDLERTVKELKAQLGKLPMPADSDALLTRWIEARTAAQQARVDAEDIAQLLGAAQAEVEGRRAELADLTADQALAAEGQTAAEAQFAALTALTDRLAGSFAALPARATALADGDATDARKKLDEWVPPAMLKVVAQRRLRADAATGLAAALDPVAGPAQALERDIDAAAALVRRGVAQIAAAETAFTAWKAIDDAAGRRGPVTPEQRDRLAKLAADDSRALAALLAIEKALTQRDQAEGDLATRRIAGPKAGQTDAAYAQELADLDAALTQKRQAYAAALADNRMTATVHAAMAQLPDAWLVETQRHDGLAAELAALAKPLGAADANAARDLLVAQVEALGQATEAELAALDAAQAAAREAAALRRGSTLLLAQLNARPTGPVGGLHAA